MPHGSEIGCDLCIIGAGAAGIALALELDGSGIDVVLLESGGFEYDDATQALYEGRSVGHHAASLVDARLRYFGGSTNHWGGFCHPLDHQDFIERPWVPDSGWPIARADLDPFYARAQPILELQDYDYSVRRWKKSLPPIFTGKMFEGRLMPEIFQLSPPTNMGELYRSALVSSANVRLFLWSNLREIVPDGTATTVERLDVACLSGNGFSILPRKVVLATGGIENPRILLASNTVAPAGLGNGHDIVGRYYMDHPSHEAATLLLNQPSQIARRPAMQPIFPQAALRPEVEDAERVQRFLTTLHVGQELFAEPEGYMAVRDIFKAFGRLEWPDDLSERLEIFLGDIDDAVSYGYQRYFADAEALGLRVHTEVGPHPQSRIMLGDSVDALGMPTVIRDWELGELDRRTIRRGLEIVGEEAGRAGLGRLRIHDWVMQPDFEVPGSGSWHHMGTTRMHADPGKGVVDAHCRVHGMSNLYIAGSSVFPTSGMANPTLTIVALAIRLADHLKAS
ncbi:MAG: GMC family oxidoreductase [Geminicoccaceae bacterium]|nr:GMC family oxidoreductase [Geminicoccaceae bacterium]MCB9944834.1 GMC family oxidoreductase [Geminicoccaceae bacterium]